MAPRKGTAGTAQGAQNANAPPQNAAASRSRAQRTRREPFSCRIEEYNAYRNECAKMGADCPLVRDCGKYGVGSDMWRVEDWMLKPEQIKAITPHNFKNGRHCMTKVMWADEALRERLLKCDPNVKEPPNLAVDPEEPIAFAPASRRNSSAAAQKSKSSPMTRSKSKSKSKTKTKTAKTAKTKTKSNLF
jgi:hypothetical protein